MKTQFCTGCGTPVSEQGDEEKFEAAEDLVEKIKTVINERKFKAVTEEFIQKIMTLIKEGKQRKQAKPKKKHHSL